MVSLLRRRSSATAPAREPHPGRGESQTKFQASVQAKVERYLKMPVLLEGLCWKRRNGMGKLRTRRAWCLRRFELRGTVLWYYLDGEEDDTENSNDDSSELGIPIAPPVIMPVNRPRGFLDFSQEKTRVHASLGHLFGAPSPFCLSILVNEQTKWKLAFDSQACLMQWLSALTNVVVQTSVDDYNVRLVRSINPKSPNQQSQKSRDQSIFLRRPPVYEPHSACNEHIISTHHQLWLTEEYTVLSTISSIKVGAQTVALTPEKSTDVELVKRQHLQELQFKEVAHRKQIHDYQKRIVELTKATAINRAKHNRQVRALQQEVREFALIAQGGWEETESDIESSDDEEDDDNAYPAVFIVCPHELV